MVREFSRGVYGAWRFACFDRRAMAWFDRSPSGVWRSFRAAFLTYPAFLAMVALAAPPDAWSRSGPLFILLIHSLGFVILLAGYPLIVLRFCRWLGREAQALDFIIAFNWSQILQTLLFLSVMVIDASGLLPEAMVALILLAASLASLAYEYFIARVTLDAGIAAACAMVLIEQLLSILVTMGAENLYRVPAA